MKHAAILSLIVVSMTVTASADWPRFRGPNGTGISDAKTVPTKWTDDDYNWVTDLPGEGHGSPIVVGDRVFLLCGNQFTAQRQIVCIHAGSGKILWTKGFKSAPHYLHRDNTYASSTPAADKNGVVAAWTTPKQFVLTALDNNGKQVWQRDFGEYKAAWGGAASPIIVDDVVVILNDQMNPRIMKPFLPEGTEITGPGKSSAIALDRATGKTRWQINRTTIIAGYSTPCVRKLADGNKDSDTVPPRKKSPSDKDSDAVPAQRKSPSDKDSDAVPAQRKSPSDKEIIFFGTGNGMTAVDPATGKVNWELADALRSRTVMSPVLAGDLIIGSCGGGLVGDKLVAVRPPSKKEDKAKVAYRITKSIPLVPTSLYKDGLLFLTCETGVISCVDATNGDEVWRKRVRGKFYASPICIDGRLFCVDRRGTVIVLDAGKEFKELARNDLGDDCYATPAVANGTLYFRTATQLMSVGGPKKP